MTGMRVALPAIEAPAATRATHCPFCAFQCGTLVTRDLDGKVAITADPDFPVNRGRMCVKGWAAGDLLGHPRRLTKPLVRRPDGTLVETGWEEALDAAAAGLGKVRRRHGEAAVGVFGSGALTNEKAYLLGKFARVALKTPNIDYNGRYCMSSAAAAANKAFGIDRGLPFPVSDIPLAKTILIMGANPIETLPPIAEWLAAQKERGGRLVVADPRLTATAREADLHLRLAPGSDLALANGLLFVAIQERLVDESFISSRTTGFDAVRRKVLEYDPARVEALTDIPEDKLRMAARWLAGPAPSMAFTGRGPEQQSKGVDSVLALVNLMLALGQAGRPGAGYGCLTGQANGQGGREHGQKADQLPGYRLIENDRHREEIARVWGVDPATLPRKGSSAYEMLRDMGEPGGVRGLMVMGSNIVVASPDSSNIEKRLGMLDFLVVCDPFANETATNAHVVLPVALWAEEDGTLTNLEGRVIRRRKVMDPPSGVLNDLEVLCALAGRLGCGDKFRDSTAQRVFSEFRRATAGGPADYNGIDYARIDQTNGVFWPCPDREGPDSPRMFLDRFHHPDGKARFHPVEDRPGGEYPDNEYPLYFTTGRLLEHYNSGSQTRLISRLAGSGQLPGLQMHPDLAASVGAVEGSRITVESRRGSASFLGRVTRAIRPDTLFAPFHWGGDHCANRLAGVALDPVSRMPEFKFAAVRIAGVEPPGEVPA